MLALSDSSDRLVVARLAHVEVTSAIVRRSREPGNDLGKMAEAMETLDREMREVFEVIELEGAVIRRALELARSHGLRAADSIQLACALLSRPEARMLPEFYLVSADQELNAAATAEGLSVQNPNLHQ
jgi:hypothetical protein